MRLASPSLPVGGFSYSEGIESAVEAGLVDDEATAPRWLVDQLHLGLARSDLPVVAAALAAWRSGDAASVAALNHWFATTREPAELRAADRADGTLARDAGCAIAAPPTRALRPARGARDPRRPGRSRSRSPPRDSGATARDVARSPSPPAGPRTWCRRR